MELSKEELSRLDFKSAEGTWIKFPRNSRHPGTFTDFEWKDYCPTVFRNLQVLDNIDHADYMGSVCEQEILMEISLRGKSSHPLYIAHDDRFVIKILRKTEMKALLEMLPNYYSHIHKYTTTLLAKFYGLHRVRLAGNFKVYFVIMRNIFKSDLYIHRHYHLKGSSQGRSVRKMAFKESTTFKDVDLDFSFQLDPLTLSHLLTQIKHDCEFLEGEGIMGYSLLLGLHVESPNKGSCDGRNFNNDTLITWDCELTLGDCEQQIPRPNLKLGMKTPARAIRMPRNEKRSPSGLQRTSTKNYCNVKLCFGIIDILQGYNMMKKIEHAYKSIHFNSLSISAVNPKLYSARFQDFLRKVFLEEEPDLEAYYGSLV